MKKVVVAESSPTIKSVADSLLRQCGYDVVCTSDGLQAWEVISGEKPDLVLVGIGLSGISGLELCRQVVSDRITGGIPVVLLIGAKDAVSEEDIISSGARGKLRKPFSPKDLLDIVGKLLGYSEKQPSDSIDFQKEDATKFAAQVSSTKHLREKSEPYNLEWLDIAQNKSTQATSKVGSLDISTEEQSLIIENDQYGLANPQPPEEPPVIQEKDEDYDWFVGEIKKEMEGKPRGEKPGNSHAKVADASPAFSAQAGDEIRFDDLSSSGDIKKSNPHPEIARAQNHANAETRMQMPAFKAPQAMGPRSISDEEIALIADRVAMKLALQIVASIDKSKIIEAVRAVLKS